MNFDTLVNSFNGWFDTRISAELIVAEAEVSARTFLEEWAEAIECGTVDRLSLVAAARAVGLAEELPDVCRAGVDRL